MNLKVNDSVIEIVKGDITEIEADAIVNAANSMLQLGGGVAGAIRRKGGPEIQRECNKIGGTPVGTAAITTGGSLKAKYVIHAVGPRYGEGEEDAKLRNATINSLKVADEHSLKSIAFPAISAGIFGFPKERCAKIMLSTTIDYLKNMKTNIEKVILCLYDSETLNIFEDEMKRRQSVNS